MRKFFVVSTLMMAIGLSFTQASANSHPYPLNYELSGGLSNGHDTASLEHKVTKETNKDGKIVYRYYYKVSYTGKEQILFMWTILDRVLSGRFAFPHIFPMETGKVYEFTLESDEAPIFISGHAKVMRKVWPSLRDHFEKEGLSVSQYDFYILSPGGGQSGPLPPSFLKPLGEK